MHASSYCTRTRALALTPPRHLNADAHPAGIERQWRGYFGEVTGVTLLRLQRVAEQTCLKHANVAHSPVRTPNPNHPVGSVDQDGWMDQDTPDPDADCPV
jgi:hypothetical protein